MVEVVANSPYLYAATACFFASSFVSDLLFLRLSLAGAYLGLILAAASGFSTNGSFQNTASAPISKNETGVVVVNIVMIVNIIVFSVHVLVCWRLIRDEKSTFVPSVENDDDKDEVAALFRYLRARCGLTPVEFRPIYQHGKFLRLERGQLVPDCQRTLYLLVEGQVECNCKFHGKPTTPFLKRSGEFFDIRMFNLFTLPVGFDNTDFTATTKMATLLFSWDVDALVFLRQLKSPRVTPFWEYLVLRALASAAVRHHLKKTDTLYDAFLVPEDSCWLEGARSRDFVRELPPNSAWWQQWHWRSSLQWVPSRGFRHRPGVAEPNPSQADLERLCRKETSQRSSWRRRRVLEIECKEESDVVV